MRGLEDFRFWIDSTDKSRGGYHQEILGQKFPVSCSTFQLDILGVAQSNGRPDFDGFFTYNLNAERAYWIEKFCHRND